MATQTRERALRALALLAAAAVAASVCGALGWWQWSRAYERAADTEATPAAALADVLAPASAPENAVGRAVTVEGAWGPGAAVAFGRDVDGVAGVLLVREFTVEADATGTGEPATVAVLVGWREQAEPPTARAGETATLSGYFRTSEAPTPSDAIVPVVDLDGAKATLAVSAAELAQDWQSPMYAAVLVLEGGEPGWAPVPKPAAAPSLNLQSAAYALEWWLFGGFAVFLAVRAMRDNDREANGEDAT